MMGAGRSGRAAAALVGFALSACSVGDARTPARESALVTAASSSFAQPAAAEGSAVAEDAGVAQGPFAPNRMGLVPVLEYHVIGPGRTEFHRTAEALQADLEMLYRRGYRPVTVAEMHERRIDQVVPAGYKAFVAVFDDASPSQFRYRERANGELVIDPTSAVGIWTRFTATHPGWRNAATFCVLSAASGGSSFFGNNNIQGQKTAWRHPKIRYLVRQGFEICNHTQWHARLDRYPDPFIQEQIARLALAVDSAVPGYRIKTLALPLGVWPRNRSLAWRGSWRDPKSGRTIAYDHPAVLEVSGGPNVSPFDPRYDGHSIDRIIAYRNAVEVTLDRLEARKTGYVSSGPPPRGRR
ncbi:MAG TPA: polysaccharide deacetylase family protein [Longimicrobium sp.]|nr:polysaccharide deacetylase family protein [Longimicrobium sp.]